MSTQWWLAQLDPYGNPTLVDGAHRDRAGAEKAATIIRRLGLSQGKVYSIAEVRLSELTGEDSPVDERAIATLNKARAQ